MAWSYRKRITIAPGVRLNVSKKGVSTTLGMRGSSINFGQNGIYLNTGIPGTGIYSRKKISGGNSQITTPTHILENKKNKSNSNTNFVAILLMFFFVIVMFYVNNIIGFISLSVSIILALFLIVRKGFEKEKKKKASSNEEKTYNIEEYAIKYDLEISNSNCLKLNSITKKESNENESYDDDFEIPDIPDKNQSIVQDDVELTIQQPEREQQDEDELDDENPKAHIGLETPYDPTLDLPDYCFPPLELLKDYGNESTEMNAEELNANQKRIVEVLNHFNIIIDKIKATIGPSVTLYEIVPSPGIRISKIKNLEDDIALSLAALGIRIIAPIPGKGTIGIEVPNNNPSIVSIKSILDLESFKNSIFFLPIVLGKTTANENYIVDLAKMPHLLITGNTGQGKSVCINTIITSLLYKKHPVEIKFVLVDTKKWELSLFSKIERHYLAKLPGNEEPIITDTRKTVLTLKSLMIEMHVLSEICLKKPLKDKQIVFH